MSRPVFDSTLPQDPSTNQEAFSFLESCIGATFDLTSVDAISLAPEKVATLFSQSKIEELQYRGRSNGDPKLLSQCANFFQRFGIDCNEKNVSLTQHILHAIEKSYSILKLDKKILIPTPTFGYYFVQLQESGYDFETIPTRKEDNFLLNPIDLEEAIVRTGSKVLLLCNPNNPIGSVMTRERAELIADVAKRHNIFVISDEAFLQNTIYENTHFPIASIDGMLEKSLTLTSITKSFGVGTLRTGFCVGPEHIVKRFAELGGFPTETTQNAIAAALEDSIENQSYHAENRQKYLHHIEFTKSKIAQLNQRFGEIFGEEKPGIDAYVKPYIEIPETGGPYILDFSGLRGKIHNGKVMETGLDAAKWLLENASVGTVPGECFFLDEKEMVVRIAISRPTEELDLAFNSAIEATSAIQNPLIAQEAIVATVDIPPPSGSPTTSGKTVSKMATCILEGISANK
ncbi:MAG: pyridoxal phosphate-dependent aminotransferase [Pseudomonadota bacterium]